MTTVIRGFGASARSPDISGSSLKGTGLSLRGVERHHFPRAKAPSSFTPGTCFMTVTFKNQLPTIFGAACAFARNGFNWS